MFQETYFRSAKAQVQATKTNFPGDNKVTENRQVARNGFSLVRQFQSTSLGRFFIGSVSTRLRSTIAGSTSSTALLTSKSTTTTETAATAAATTTATDTSIRAYSKSSFSNHFYYIIALTSLLILTLCLNRYASENNLSLNHKTADARAGKAGGLMLSPSWPGVVAILSSAEMAAAASVLNEHQADENETRTSNNEHSSNNSSSSNDYLIRTKRSIARDSGKNKNSSSISSQASRSTLASTTTQSVATVGEQLQRQGQQQQQQQQQQQPGKTSPAKRGDQRSRLLLKANSASYRAGSATSLRLAANLNIEPNSELDLASSSNLELQRRKPSTRVTGNQQAAKHTHHHQQQPAAIAHSAAISNAQPPPPPPPQAPVSVELTERQASYSPNNRGAINQANSSLISLSSSIPRSPKFQAGNWIPILSSPTVSGAATGRASSQRQQQQAGTTKPTQQVRPLTPVGLQLESSSAPPSTYRQTDNNNLTPAELVLSSNLHYNSNNHHHQNLQQHNYHHDHPAHRHQPNRHWRRPRLNVHPVETGIGGGIAQRRPSKMYKRVLLCDKTLVSLDYVKRGHPLPFEAHFELEGDTDFDDNIIDLDSNLNQIFTSLDNNNNNNNHNHNHNNHNNNNNNNININRRSSNATLTSVPSNVDSMSTAESGLPDELLLEVKRRSYLNDEDPLVKCDMWDLEKGLKNRKPPLEILQMAVKADFDSVRDAINRCRQLSERTLPPDEDEYRDGIGIEIMSTEDLISLFSMKRGLLPGTKWCGLGDQASSYNDLGPKHRIDICCRAHDHCPIRLKPFRNDYGVLNIGLYTKSHCDCDADFYRCLREAHSRTADMLGNLYFNVMKLQCMREERMKICREMKPIALGFERCIRYEESPVKTVFKFTTPPVAY